MVCIVIRCFRFSFRCLRCSLKLNLWLFRLLHFSTDPISNAKHSNWSKWQLSRPVENRRPRTVSTIDLLFLVFILVEVHDLLPAWLPSRGRRNNHDQLPPLKPDILIRYTTTTTTRHHETSNVCLLGSSPRSGREPIVGGGDAYQQHERNITLLTTTQQASRFH